MYVKVIIKHLAQELHGTTWTTLDYLAYQQYIVHDVVLTQ